MRRRAGSLRPLRAPGHREPRCPRTRVSVALQRFRSIPFSSAEGNPRRPIVVVDGRRPRSSPTPAGDLRPSFPHTSIRSGRSTMAGFRPRTVALSRSFGTILIVEQIAVISRFGRKNPVIHVNGFIVLNENKQSLNDGSHNCTSSEIAKNPEPRGAPVVPTMPDASRFRVRYQVDR